MTIVRRQYIVPPHYRKQEQIAARLRKQAAREEKQTEERWRDWSSELKPLKLKHNKFVATYARYYYAGGRTA